MTAPKTIKTKAIHRTLKAGMADGILLNEADLQLAAATDQPVAAFKVSKKKVAAKKSMLTDAELVVDGASFSGKYVDLFSGAQEQVLIYAQHSAVTSDASSVSGDSSAVGNESSAAKGGAESGGGLSTGQMIAMGLGIVALGGAAVAISRPSSNSSSSPNSSPSSTPPFTPDVVSPQVQSLSAQDNVITLSFSEALDPNSPPTISAFDASTGGVANTITAIAISGNTVVLTLSRAVATGEVVSLSYGDKTIANDAYVIQDLAGNDATGFLQGVVADGYISGAKIYVDANGDGIAQDSEYTGVTTNTDGTFFLKETYPGASIIAVGGTNMDTGLPQLTPLKAPAGALAINPISTLIQTIVEIGGGSAEAAAELVATKLGLTGAGADLLRYNPLAANDFTVQQAAAQIATIVNAAYVYDQSYDERITVALAREFMTHSGAIDLANPEFIAAVLMTGNLEDGVLYSDLLESSISISSATSIGDISLAQANLGFNENSAATQDQNFIDTNVANLLYSNSTKITANLNYDFADALIATRFAQLAYDNQKTTYAASIAQTGWQGISLDSPKITGKAFDSVAGYGITDPVTPTFAEIKAAINPLNPNQELAISEIMSSMESFALAARRDAADGTRQFVISFEGSAPPLSQPADWIVNATKYGWSYYYESLMPIMADVIRQALDEKRTGKDVELIIAGHSLGGAAASVAYADLFVYKDVNRDGVNDISSLWNTIDAPLRAGSRIYDQPTTIGYLNGSNVWVPYTDAEIYSLIADTNVYTIGAPSFLIEPTKLSGINTLSFLLGVGAASVLGSPLISAAAALAGISGIDTVRNSLLPDLDGYSSHVFQFEHDNSSWFVPGDIVADLGSRDAGTVLSINLDNDVQYKYTGSFLYFVPGGTHGSGNYVESLARLVTGDPVLKSNNDLASIAPVFAEVSGASGTGTNDLFVNQNNVLGGAGNDLLRYKSAGTYLANGGVGDDTYVVSDFGVNLTIQALAGLDNLIFDLMGDITKADSGTSMIYTITNGSTSSSVTVENSTALRVDNLIQVIESADANWTLKHYDPVTGVAYT